MTINYTTATQQILSKMQKTGTITFDMIKKSPLAAKLSNSQIRDLVKCLKDDGRISQGEFKKLCPKGTGDRAPIAIVARTVQSFTKNRTISSADKKMCSRIVYRMVEKGSVSATFIREQFPNLTTQQAAALAKAVNNDGRIDGKELKDLGRFGPRVAALAKFIGNKPVKLHRASRVITRGARAYLRCGQPKLGTDFVSHNQRLGGKRCSYTLEGSTASEINTTRAAVRTVKKLHKQGVDSFRFFKKLVSKRPSTETLEAMAKMSYGHLTQDEREQLADIILKRALLQGGGDPMRFRCYRIIIKKLTGKNSALLDNHIVKEATCDANLKFIMS